MAVPLPLRVSLLAGRPAIRLTNCRLLPEELLYERTMRIGQVRLLQRVVR
jgi:hypothetical protein